MKLEHYLIVVIIIVALGTVVMINSQTTPGYSKVYFDNSTVPDYLIPNTTYNVVFIIESHENGPEKYFFKAYLDDKVLREGDITVGSGKMAQILFNFSINRITYKKVILEEQTTTYDMNGILGIVGRNVNSNIFFVNCSNSSGNLIYLPPSYTGPSNLSFLMNTSKNLTLVKMVEDRSNTSRVVKEYKLTLIRLGKDKYRVTVEESKIMYIPKSITIAVVVETSNGKVYRISKRLPVLEG